MHASRRCREPAASARCALRRTAAGPLPAPSIRRAPEHGPDLGFGDGDVSADDARTHGICLASPGHGRWSTCDLSGLGPHARVWDLASGDCRLTYCASGPLSALAVDSTRDIFLCATMFGDLAVLDPQNMPAGRTVVTISRPFGNRDEGPLGHQVRCPVSRCDSNRHATWSTP